MAPGLRLQQKQSQSLVMTPKLAQSIKLLQMGHVDLLEFVNAEIEKNPLLELETSKPEVNPERRENQGSVEDGGSISTGYEEAPVVELDQSVRSDLPVDAEQKTKEIDVNFENVYDRGTAGAESTNSTTGPTAGKQNSNRSHDEDFDAVSQMGEAQTLSQFLDFQVSVSFKNPERRKIANYIAHMLDEDGYFREPIDEVARKFNCHVAHVHSVLEKFQTFEPTGIAARDLSECLKIQLREAGGLDQAMEVFLSRLDLLAKRDLGTLRKLCGVSNETFNNMIREIKALDPRPALQFEPILSEPVLPDVLIRQREDGGWSINLNPETLPNVLIDREYHAELSSAVGSDEGKAFVDECMSTASWLVKSLDQRAQTILKVATEIVKQQDMFFVKGVENLKPMTLKTVAEAIKMHESTVSRVTSNKYLLCDQGLFELKYFFSSAISGGEGEESHSAETVKHRIKQFVNAEDPKKVLSDDRIVALLQETGIEIARRTVAKYRESLRIPSSVERRRAKAFD